jgi:hypothetical protein
LLFLEPNGQGVKLAVDLKAVPVFMCCEGQFDIDFKIFVACRNGCIYTVGSKGVISDLVI